MNQKLKVALGVVFLAAIGALSVWGYCAWGAKTAMRTAERKLEKGFPALAADALDPYRRRLINDDRGCRLLLQTYFQTKNAERLDWAAQGCLDSGKEFLEVFVGLASAREFAGRDPEALQVLSQALPKFDKVPDIYYRLSLILRRNKRDAEAAAMFLKALERAQGNQQLAVEGLQYFSSLQRWTEAKVLADALKNVQTDNAELKLMIARALLKGGDRANAEVVIRQAQDLLAKAPADYRAAAESAYTDILNPQAAAPAAEKKRK